MLDKKTYVNGQQIYELIDDMLTFYYKNGKLKAKGAYRDQQLDGEWIFYRETGQLWQIGYFKMCKKQGTWTRYDRNDQIEYKESFIEDKKINT
jgi:antitoxin component YwqK of YwqJK toxin-antitoxin module